MQPGSHRDLISEAIRISSRPLDDDQLAARTGISPRQRVNQICHELEHAGLVRRRFGPAGKIVNEWLGSRDGQPDGAPGPSGSGVSRTAALTGGAAVQAGYELPPGSSREQRDAERVMLDLLGRQLGRDLSPARLAVPSGERVEVDGTDADRSVLVECWAHQGPPKSAQCHLAAVSFMPGGRSWAARAFQDLGVTVFVVELPADLRHDLLRAQN